MELQRMPVSSLSPSGGFLASRRIVGVGLALAAAFVALAERDLATLPFTFACGALIYLLALALTARRLFAAVLALGLLSVSAVASMLKYKFLAANAHIFDLRFYLNRPDTALYLFDQFRWAVVSAALAGAGFLLAAVLAFRRDAAAADIGRGRLFAGVLVLAAVAPLALPIEAEELTYHSGKNHFASSFFASLSDLGRLTRVDPLAERIAHVGGGGPFESPGPCVAGPDAPDIFLVLSESGVGPSSVPGWRWPAGFDDFLRSYDGKAHKARVETYGGGTWIAHTSVLAGLSMADFGWIRSYVTMVLNGRLRHSLPQSLAACGYQTAIVSPQSFHFVNEGPMLKGLGIKDYLDLKALGAPSKHEPDSFYFGKALAYYDRHQREDRRPLFMFISTMSAHSPYDYRFQPERVATGEPFGNAPQADEYLRRAVFAQEDYRAFVAALEGRRNGRRVLAAEFGDHQPAITHLTYTAKGAAEALQNFAAPIYETFYAVQTLGFQPKAALPQVEALDTAFLGVTLLEVAGLPLDPPYQALRALRDVCAGAFHTCADRPMVDLYLKRLVQSGLLVAPGADRSGATPMAAASPAR